MYSALADLARELLLPRPTTAAVERVWSFAKRVIPAERRGLTFDNFVKRLTLGAFYRLQANEDERPERPQSTQAGAEAAGGAQLPASISPVEPFSEAHDVIDSEDDATVVSDAASSR